MDIKALAEKYESYIIERRRYYHSCPELSGEEKERARSFAATSRPWASPTSESWKTAAG